MRISTAAAAATAAAILSLRKASITAQRDDPYWRITSLADYSARSVLSLAMMRSFVEK